MRCIILVTLYMIYFSILHVWDQARSCFKAKQEFVKNKFDLIWTFSPRFCEKQYQVFNKLNWPCWTAQYGFRFPAWWQFQRDLTYENKSNSSTMWPRHEGNKRCFHKVLQNKQANTSKYITKLLRTGSFKKNNNRNNLHTYIL